MPDTVTTPPVVTASDVSSLQAQLDALRAKIGYVAPPPLSPQEQAAKTAEAIRSYSVETHGTSATQILIAILTSLLALIQGIITPPATPTQPIALPPTVTPVVTAQSDATAGGTIPVVPS